MNLNIILQVLLVSTFSLGIVGAAIDDRHLCAIGLVTAFVCAVLLVGREKE